MPARQRTKKKWARSKTNVFSFRASAFFFFSSVAKLHAMETGTPRVYGAAPKRKRGDFFVGTKKHRQMPGARSPISFVVIAVLCLLAGTRAHKPTDDTLECRVTSHAILGERSSGGDDKQSALYRVALEVDIETSGGYTSMLAHPRSSWATARQRDALWAAYPIGARALCRVDDWRSMHVVLVATEPDSDPDGPRSPMVRSFDADPVPHIAAVCVVVVLLGLVITCGLVACVCRVPCRTRCWRSDGCCAWWRDDSDHDHERLVANVFA